MREYSRANNGDIACNAVSVIDRIRRNGWSCGTRFSDEI